MSKVERRHREIVTMLSSIPIASVTELSEKLDVSTETIRKDLKQLAANDLVVLTHGGVALAAKNPNDYQFDKRIRVNTEKKMKVAKLASGLIEEGDAIILESSTTTLALVQELLKQPELVKTLVIITNSFRISHLLDQKQACDRLFFLGGWTNFSEHATYGHHTTESLGSFHVDKCFLSGAGLSEDLMVTGYDDDDVNFQKNAMRAATKTILMLEQGKYPKSAVISVESVFEFDYLVTDIEFTEDIKADFQRKNVFLIS